MTSTRDSAELVNNLKDSAFDFNIYSSVASAKADTKLKAGDTVQTTGYYSENDGGGATYIVVAGGTGTDDGGSYHDMANGNQLELIKSKKVDIRQFGAVPSTDATTQIQNCIDYCSSNKINMADDKGGEYFASALEWKSDVYFTGAGYTSTVFKQVAGSNTNFIFSSGDIFNIAIRDMQINGNYFAGNWNDSAGVLNNTTGNGLDLKCLTADIDILIYNVAGVGLFMRDLDSNPPSTFIDRANVIRVFGKDFGQEGMIIQGPNDWILDLAFIGRAGILPRPNAETTFATSNEYGGAPVAGIVIDGANIEINEVHVFACWSGTGFQTRNTVRLTKGGRIISESNNAQVDLSSGTYGGAYFDVRNVSLYHPNWSAATPSYTAPDRRWDAVTIDSDDLQAEITLKRTITAPTRVTGTIGLVSNGKAQLEYIFSNNTAPTGDPEAGSLYSGDAAWITGSGGKLNASISRSNGRGVYITSEGADVHIDARSCITGAAIDRDTVGNSKRGNRITGTVLNCDTAFNSTGTPTSEIVSLAIEGDSGNVGFSGDQRDVNRGQIWDISSSIANVAKTTSQHFLRTSVIDVSSTGTFEVTVPHKYLYTPPLESIMISVEDQSSPSLARLGYVRIKSADSSSIVISYAVDTAGTGGGEDNIRFVLSVG